MKAREFFDELRMYPDLDVDIFVKLGGVLLNVSGVDCDEQGNNLIITLPNGEKEEKENA